MWLTPCIVRLYRLHVPNTEAASGLPDGQVEQGLNLPVLDAIFSPAVAAGGLVHARAVVCCENRRGRRVGLAPGLRYDLLACMKGELEDDSVSATTRASSMQCGGQCARASCATRALRPGQRGMTAASGGEGGDGFTFFFAGFAGFAAFALVAFLALRPRSGPSSLKSQSLSTTCATVAVTSG